MLKEKILRYLQEHTYKFKIEGNNDKFTAKIISEIFAVKRNTISHYLNQLTEENLLIKINTRPVYFLHKKVFEETNFTIKDNLFNSFDDLFMEKNKAKKEDIFDRLIGSDGSLKDAIEQIKTSIFYPGKGLPIMLNGPTGVGKSFMAELIYKYSIENNVVPKDAPFISFNCAQYYNNPELLSSNLFGYVKGAFTGADKNTEGMLKATDGGILFLDEVHRLSEEGQEKLFTFMDKGIYRKMGENSGWNKASVRLIFATTESLRETFLQTFLRRIPISIPISGLDGRSKGEKLQFIYSFLINEANIFKKNISISKNTIDIIMNYSFEGNIGELKNTITYICAKAHSKNIYEEIIEIKFSHLPDEILRLSLEDEEPKIKGKETILVKQDTNINELVCDSESKHNLIKSTYKSLFNLYDSVKKKDINNEFFESNVFNEINVLMDKLIFEKTRNDDSVMLQYTINSIQDIIKYMESSYNIKFNGNSLYTIAYFLHAKNYDIFSWSKKYDNTRNELYQYILKYSSEEHLLTKKLINLINSKMDVTLTTDDEIFLTFYIKSLNLSREKNRAKVVILAHGYATASSMASVVNRMLQTNIIEGFDMPIDISVEQITDKLRSYIDNNDISKGLIILVDMGSLKDIYSKIKGYLNVPVAIINNVSTQMALFIGDMVSKDIYLEEMVERLKTGNETKYKIIYPKIKKEKAIVASCFTGIGTAKQIQKLLVNSIPEELNIKVIVHDYDRIKANGTTEALFQLYDVLAIVGTANPSVDRIKYISLEDLISGKGEDKIYKIFKDVADQATITKINNNIVRNFSLESVVGSLTILDTNKILIILEECFNTLEILLKRRLPNDKKMALYVHISCLVERLIRQTPIEVYPDIDVFKQCQKSTIDIIKKAFSVIEEQYNVKINIEEIGYIYDILSNHQGKSTDF